MIVLPVPSVIESPKQTMTRVRAATCMSTSSRKNHDAVEKGIEASPFSCPLAPLPGGLM
ncbi:hypothetical protein D3C83_314290 [compost metagenome]